MFLFGKGKVSGTMPPDMKYDDAARMPNLSNNDWQKLNKLIAESDPELGRVMKNADKFLETLIDHNKTLRDIPLGGLDKIKPELATHLLEKFPDEVPAVQRQRF
ncbi:hypothetical protein EIP86_002185 [Pleurotus ostreatoroseus]|nr:hypothetical protein EIP86_002185 [Pleurotus ostreatoroseus]